MNMALLVKWFWRLKTERDSLWVRCVTACHNIKLIDGKPVAKASLKGVWWNIMSCVEELKSGGVSVEESLIRQLGNGKHTYFWKDRWLDNKVLKDEFSQLYKIEGDKNCMVNQRLVWDNNEKLFKQAWEWKRTIRRGRETNEFETLKSLTDGIKLSEMDDNWRWKEGVDGKFSVAKLRKYIADREQDQVNDEFYWSNWVPLKVNCFVWRLKQGRVPVMCKLANRGVIVESKICKVCQQEEEEIDHAFFRCTHAQQVWDWFKTWSGMMHDIPINFTSMEADIKTGAGDKKLVKLGMALTYVVLWTIWKTRNGAVFNNRKVRAMNTADEVQLISFNWIKNRSRSNWIKWCDWSAKPTMNCDM